MEDGAENVLKGLTDYNQSEIHLLCAPKVCTGSDNDCLWQAE